MTSNPQFFTPYHAATFPPQCFQRWPWGKIMHRRKKKTFLVSLLLPVISSEYSADCFLKKDTSRVNGSNSSARKLSPPSLSPALPFMAAVSMGRQNQARGIWATGSGQTLKAILRACVISKIDFEGTLWRLLTDHYWQMIDLVNVCFVVHVI